MDKDKVKKTTEKSNKRDIVISIRLNKEMKTFIEKQDYSPALIFYEALKDLGYDGEI